jgi:hypothetical protein
MVGDIKINHQTQNKEIYYCHLNFELLGIVKTIDQTINRQINNNGLA